MPVTTRDSLREQLKKRQFEPVYTLFGEEGFLRDTAARYIADLCFGEGDLREFNEAEYSLASPDNIGSALAAAAQLPMMAARRVVRVNDVRVAASSNRDTLKEDAEEPLAAYLKDPSESTVLIFVADELNGNRRLTKLLKEKTVAVEFKRFDERELHGWVIDELKRVGSEADARTIDYLIEVAGDDLQRISTELKKLSVAALPGKTITADLIDALVPNSREISNFGLTDNLLAGRKREALHAMKKVLDDGVDPLALLGLVSSNYRRLLIAADMLSRGEPRAAVVSASRVPYGAAQEQFFNAARSTDPRKLATAIERIAETDLAIKTSAGGTGPVAARMQFEMLVCELASM